MSRRALLAALALPCGVAVAAPELQLHAGQMQYDAVETASDGRGVFNRERGRLQGGGAGLHWAHGDWAWRAGAEQRRGELDYQGQTQFGIPLYTRTRLQWQRWQLQLQHGWLPGGAEGAGTRLVLRLGAEGSRSLRQIQPTPISSALSETLRAQSAQLQLAWSQPLAVAGLPLQLSAWLERSRPWRQTLDVDAHGSFDPLRLHPARHTARAWGGAAELAPAPGWRLLLSGERRRLQPGTAPASPVFRGGVAVGAAGYPGSRVQQHDWRLALSWAP